MAPIEQFHVSRTFHAMELLAIRPRSAPELAAGLGVHVRTARRLLHRLHADGYVELSGDRRRRYRPTMRVVALAGQVVERSPVTQAALPQVAALRDEIGADCHLCVPSYVSALCLVHAPTRAEGRCRPQLRELVPCHCTAAGKALLAWRQSSLSTRRPSPRGIAPRPLGARRCVSYHFDTLRSSCLEGRSWRCWTMLSSNMAS